MGPTSEGCLSPPVCCRLRSLQSRCTSQTSPHSPELQSLEREKDAMHEELQASRKQSSDAAAEVRSCQAAATEHVKAVSSLLSLPSPHLTSGPQHSSAHEPPLLSLCSVLLLYRQMACLSTVGSESNAAVWMQMCC